jgi:hypothetical protein
MRTRSKLLLTALTAALVFAAAVSTASARRFALSNQLYRVTWSELELLGHEPFGGTLTIKCPVTLEGSLHSRTLSKVSGQLIGYVTAAFVRSESCVGGTARVLTETLPWHVRYDRFIGALPGITGIRIQLVGAKFLVTFPPGINCLFTSTAREPAFGILEREAGGLVNRLRADETVTVPKTPNEQATLNSAFCPPGGIFAGAGEVFLQGSTSTRISVTLVQ